MGTGERRASKRYEFSLPATFRDGQKEIEGTVTSVGRHGVFIHTETPRRQGELFQLNLTVPSLDGGEARNVRVMAVAAWAIRDPQASEAGRLPGMGVKFFMMAAEEKCKWDHFYLSLQRRDVPEQDWRRVICTLGGPMKFYVRPRDFLQLFRFQKHSMASGRYFLRSPLLVDEGKHVQVILIHPESKEEFPLTGKVMSLQADGPEALRGMRIAWCNVLHSTHQDFQRFVIDGVHPIEEVDLRLAS